MSAEPTRVTSTIEHLDFSPEIPCEHPTHDSRPGSHGGHGTLLIRRFPHCGQGPSLMIVCEGIWVYAGAHGLMCGGCGVHRTRAESWLLIERIGGAS